MRINVAKQLGSGLKVTGIIYDHWRDLWTFELSWEFEKSFFDYAPRIRALYGRVPKSLRWEDKPVSEWVIWPAWIFVVATRFIANVWYELFHRALDKGMISLRMKTQPGQAVPWYWPIYLQTPRTQIRVMTTSNPTKIEPPNTPTA